MDLAQELFIPIKQENIRFPSTLITVHGIELMAGTPSNWETPSYSLLTTKLWWRRLRNSRRGIITLFLCSDDWSWRPWSLMFNLRRSTFQLRRMSLLTACLAFRTSLLARRRPGFTRDQTRSHRKFYLGSSDISSAQCHPLYSFIWLCPPNAPNHVSLVFSWFLTYRGNNYSFQSSAWIVYTGDICHHFKFISDTHDVSL